MELDIQTPHIERGYLQLRRTVYSHLRKSEDLLLIQKMTEALEEVSKALDTLQETRSFVVESNEPEYKYDLSTALQLKTKILRIQEEGMEDETKLLNEALELSSHDEQLRLEVVKFAIKNILIGEEEVMLMPDSRKSPAEKILSLIGLINSAFSQALLLIEINNRGEVFEVLPSLPVIENLSHSQLKQLMTLLSRSREKEKIISWLLETEWSCEPLEKERILVQCLLLSSREARVETSFTIFGLYTQLTIPQQTVKWEYVGVVLSQCDKMILKMTEERSSSPLLEKWLGGAALLASVFQRSKAYQHFAKHLLTHFLKEGKTDKLEKYLSSIRGSRASGVLKITCLHHLNRGHYQAAAPVVAEMLRNGCLLEKEEIENVLGLFISQLIEADRLDLPMLEDLVEKFTEFQFYHSLPVFRLSLQLATRLGGLDKMARRLYDEPELGWMYGEDREGSVASLCWNLGRTVTTPLTKHFLLLLGAEVLYWRDPDQDEALLASLPAGEEALRKANWSFKPTIMEKLVESVDRLEGRLQGELKRALELFKLKMVLATERECKWEPCTVLNHLIKARDKIGLLAFSKLAAADSQYIDLTLTALCEALKLEDHVTNREMLGVACLEQISVVPSSVKVWQVSSQLNAINWTERGLLVEALMVSWNIWVRVTSSGESSEVCEIWFDCVASLHNKLTEHCDYISCRLEKPTLGLMRKIQRTIVGIY